jgi:hypothetical protein
MRLWILALVSACWLAGCATSTPERRLASALIFHAPFDGTTDAAVAGGDRRIQFGKGWGAPRVPQPGLPPGGAVRIETGAGRFGDALRFDHKINEFVGYRVAGNFPVPAVNGAGSVSFWLRVTPDEDIEPGYCDVIQVTSKAWDDASFFVEFTKDEKPREMRLGVYADKNVWNPQGRDWGKMAFEEKPLTKVERPPFRRDRWTHVVFTWENFNSGKPNGVVRLHLDGEPAGVITAREQTFHWDVDQAVMMLGLAYTGWMDDLSVFSQALSDEEVRTLHRQKDGVAGLRSGR